MRLQQTTRKQHATTTQQQHCNDNNASKNKTSQNKQEPSSIQKVAEIDDHIGCAMSGLTADAKTLIDHARAETQGHRFSYNEPMPVESCTQSLCDLALQFGEDDDDGGGGGMVRAAACSAARRAERCVWLLAFAMAWGQQGGSERTGAAAATSGRRASPRKSLLTFPHTPPSTHAHNDTQSRPFGVALLIAGWDRDAGPVLYHTDPSGTFVRYKCMAIGSGSEGALTALQEHYKPDMTLADAEVLALSTLKQVMEEKVSATNVDIARVAPTYHLYSADEVEGVIGRL